MPKDKELQDHERAHSGKPGTKVRHGADAVGSVTKSRRFYQDGAHFYDSDTDTHLASYKGLVKHDYDMTGAKNARSTFMSNFPNYKPDKES